MIEESNIGQSSLSSNPISPETGALDSRFTLWRMFCLETGVAVESMPSDLTDEMKEKWEAIKEEQLHKPAEKRA